MAKEKVYKLAKDFKVSSEALVQILRGMGIVVKSHMSTVDGSLREKIKQKFEQERAEIKKQYARKKQKLAKAKEELLEKTTKEKIKEKSDVDTKKRDDKTGKKEGETPRRARLRKARTDRAKTSEEPILESKEGPKKEGFAGGPKKQLPPKKGKKKGGKGRQARRAVDESDRCRFNKKEI